MKEVHHYDVLACCHQVFDSGKVKVNLAPIEADRKPENHMSENKTCDEYHDYFDTYEEAAAYAADARKA